MRNNCTLSPHYEELFYEVAIFTTLSCSMSPIYSIKPKNILPSSIMCSQIWLSPLVDDHQPNYSQMFFFFKSSPPLPLSLFLSHTTFENFPFKVKFIFENSLSFLFLFMIIFFNVKGSEVVRLGRLVSRACKITSHEWLEAINSHNL